MWATEVNFFPQEPPKARQPPPFKRKYYPRSKLWAACNVNNQSSPSPLSSPSFPWKYSPLTIMSSNFSSDSEDDVPMVDSTDIADINNATTSSLSPLPQISALRSDRRFSEGKLNKDGETKTESIDVGSWINSIRDITEGIFGDNEEPKEETRQETAKEIGFGTGISLTSPTATSEKETLARFQPIFLEALQSLRSSGTFSLWETQGSDEDTPKLINITSFSPPFSPSSPPDIDRDAIYGCQARNELESGDQFYIFDGDVDATLVEVKEESWKAIAARKRTETAHIHEFYPEDRKRPTLLWAPKYKHLGSKYLRKDVCSCNANARYPFTI